MNVEFKVGDKLRYIAAREANGYFFTGGVYEVLRVANGFVDMTTELGVACVRTATFIGLHFERIND